MDSNENKVDINHVLPLHLVIKSAGSDLYRIGLSLFLFGSQKRKKYCNPCITIFINIMFILKCVLSLSLRVLPKNVANKTSQHKTSHTKCPNHKRSQA